MSGVMRVVPAKEPREKHLAGVIELSNRKEIRYIDMRQFGLMVARPGHEVDAMPEFAHYGPEPLSAAFTAEYLREALAKRSAALAVALMDQGLVAGIGKIYADEILFRAGIRPTRKAGTLTRPLVRRLWQAIRDTLEEAVACGGTSAEDETYRDVYGLAGRFQDRLMVYQRTGEACRVCRTAIRRQRMTGGRGMHWCPKCQK
jgi:formamidopyrimidine-DNA glycosylase